MPSSVGSLRAHETPEKLLVSPHVGVETELLGQSKSSLSTTYICQQTLSCFRLLRHEIVEARLFAREIAGNSIPARIAMIATTTNNSINVNADRFSIGFIH